MYIGHIAGIAFIPVSVIMYLNIFGITKLNSVFGISMLLIAAIGLLLIQIGDIIHSHFMDEYILVSWIVCIILMAPSFIYFASLMAKLSPAVVGALPIILASFLFVEGLSSFFIGSF